MSSIKNPAQKKAQSLKKDHRVFTLEGNKTFRGKWRKKKRRLTKKERSAAQRILTSRAEDEPQSPQRQIPRKLRKAGVVTLGRALDIREHEPQKRFSAFHYSSRDHQETYQAMQPTTLWRCVPTLTLARILGMKQSAPPRVVADLESR